MLEPCLKNRSIFPRKLGLLNSESDDNLVEISVKN